VTGWIVLGGEQNVTVGERVGIIDRKVKSFE